MKRNEAPNPWTTLSNEIKYENPWIRVEEHKVINPAGKPGIYGKVHYKNIAVAIIPLDDAGNTWIVGQYRYTLHSYEWEVPEGGSPIDVDPLEGAKRELLEEVGLVADSYEKILEMQLSNSVSDEISYTYVAKGLKFVGQKPEEDEILSVKKLPFAEVVNMVMRGEIRDALSVASVLKLHMLLNRAGN
ncbi:MAG: NUDIX hydrolase [Chitinophagales bacterium]|nr:NUDIX hydrolase [Chitinophagales bacterium]MDW8272797.1 NUDIX hydrolase [Chitinophagales bacterium]